MKFKLFTGVFAATVWSWENSSKKFVHCSDYDLYYSSTTTVTHVLKKFKGPPMKIFERISLPTDRKEKVTIKIS